MMPIVKKRAILLLPKLVGKPFYNEQKNKTHSPGNFLIIGKRKALMFAKAALLLGLPVAAQTDDQSAVKVAANELAVVNAGAAYGNLTLPANINGATVRWSSGNEKLVTTGGEVTRPKAHNAKVVLHATITKGTATASRDITVLVVKAFKKAADQAYLFFHFTFSDEKIYFSLSKGNTALDWRELNNGKPVFSFTIGTTGLRDPYIVRSPEGDKFYLMATDLKWFSGDKGPDHKRYIQVWEPNDLVNWSAQQDALFHRRKYKTPMLRRQFGTS